MCGIAGFVDWEGSSTTSRHEIVTGMANTLAPRGPDAAGTWADRYAALGHRRLAVIDVAGGSQPMHAAGCVLVFSGEIYNFRELRRELEGCGRRFETASDTEVLLRAYQEWGHSCVSRLNGMFAFALWDSQEQVLLLARDRLGIKPLYLYRNGRGVIFGSEPKAVLAHPDVRPEIDAEGIAELFVVPGAPTPGHGVFRGLEELLPAHTLIVSPRGEAKSRYWSLESAPHPDDYATTVNKVRDQLTAIVDRQAVSDVPIATLLSGGIDSSVITALTAARQGGHAVGGLRTFSMDYAGEDEEFPPDAWRPSRDGPHAMAAAAHLGTRHSSLVLEADAVLRASGDSLSARDLPGWGDLDASLGLLFRHVRREATVALSGESGDEVFGGYPWHSNPAAIQRDGFPWLDIDFLPSSLLRAEVAEVVKPADYLLSRSADARAATPRLPGESRDDLRIREALHLGLTRWLPLLLNRKDRLSMAAGLEVRVPYCDHEFVQYVWNVPWAMKRRGDLEKGLLRDAAADLLPTSIIRRRKSAPPACHSPRYVGHLRERVLDLVADESAPLFQLVDREKLRAGLAAGALPGPTPGPGTSFALGYLTDIDRWLRAYDVQVSLGG
jgi:asparagine synthase (glutamine-hydrolysing)